MSLGSLTLLTAANQLIRSSKKESKANNEKKGALITWDPQLVHEMNGASSLWEPANWSNGNPFNNTWLPNNIKFNNGVLSLTLNNNGCPSACRGLPYASGEYRTTEEIYGYGYYEARIKPAKGNGLIAGSFYVYRGVYGQQSHDEIDIEFLGKDTTKIQINYHVEGKGGHERIINLGFDASKDFHNYGFKWTSKSIAWYVDGKEVHKVENIKVPYRPCKIMINLWAGIGVDGWLNQFKYYGEVRAQYDWIKYSPIK